jgi:Domain of unknown function (DUF1905)
VTIRQEIADELHARYHDDRRAFGSLRVRVSLGRSTWSTSLFGDRRSGSYPLPLKAEIRTRERVEAGQL